MDELPPVGSRIIAEPGFPELLAWAKGVAEVLGRTELCLETFVLGAHLAHKNRALANAGVIDHHIGAHKPQFEAYLRIRGINLDDIQPSTAELHATRAFDLAVARAEGDEEDDPVRTLLNYALTGIVAAHKLERVAFHEAGHAIVSLVLRPEIRIEYASIMSDEDSAGAVSFDITSPHFSGAHARTLEDIKETLCVSLAGQVATIKAFGTDSANEGVGMDMVKATRVAFNAVALQGLDPEFGPIHLPTINALMNEFVGHQGGGYLFDAAQRRTQALIKSAYRQTTKLVDAHWGAIGRLAQLLLEKNVVYEDAIQAVMKA